MKAVGLKLHTHQHKPASPIRPWYRGATRRLAQFAEAEGFEIVAEFVEVEAGKGSDALDRRPQLSAALAKARSCRRQARSAFARRFDQCG